MIHFYRHLAQRGFTLFEVLLAAALSVMVLALLSGALHLTLKEWERTENRLDTKLEAALSLLQIERALHGAFPHVYREAEENRVSIYFHGEEDALSWVSTVGPGRQPGLTAWLMQRGNDGKGLRLAYAPAFAGNPEKALKKAIGREKTPLLFDDYKVSFKYLRVNDQRDPDDSGRSEWLAKWEGEKRNSLPWAVRVLLEREEDSSASLEIIGLILAHQHPGITPFIF